MRDRIPLSVPDVGQLDREAILKSFDDGWIAAVGPEIGAFEAELASYVGAESCAVLSSGTSALQLALWVSGVRPGDEVVVQSATFAASAFAVVHLGATPVFCDSSRSTWCIDPELLNDFLSQRAAAGRLPSAVMPVDLYGLAPNYAELVAVCSRFDVPIVEDAAEALGSLVTPSSHAGTLGQLGVVSFNGNKIITTGSGGAIVGQTELVDRARWLASQAREDEIFFLHNEVGTNMRMPSLLAALGRSQLRSIDEKVQRRREIHERYRAHLTAFEWMPIEVVHRSNCWLSVGLLPAGVEPLRLCGQLAEQDIEARPFWKPMHQQPVFADNEMLGGPVADELFRRGICLPSSSNLSEADQDLVIERVDWLIRG